MLRTRYVEWMASEIAAALRIQTIACIERQKDVPTISPSSTSAQPAAALATDSSTAGTLPPSGSAPSAARRIDGDAGWDGRCCVGTWDCDAAAAIEASHWYVN